jgi:hypothetical protein
LKAYKTKKTKIRAPFTKARDTIKNQLVGIIKDGKSIDIIDLLDKALKEAAEAGKQVKAD